MTTSASAHNVRNLGIALLLVGLVAPLVIYPVFLMKFLCFALFAAGCFVVAGSG